MACRFTATATTATTTAKSGGRCGWRRNAAAAAEATATTTASTTAAASGVAISAGSQRPRDNVTTEGGAQGPPAVRGSRVCAVRVKGGQNVVEVAVVECRDDDDDDDAGLGSRHGVFAARGTIRSG